MNWKQKLMSRKLWAAAAGVVTGLAMAFGCIANHHGWIHVDSAPGEGCHITIFLPRADAPPREPL